MNNSNLLKGLGIGLVTGAVLGILFAPKSGRETRENLKDAADKLNEKLSDKISKIKEMSKEKCVQIAAEAEEGFDKMNITDEKRQAIKNELKSCFVKIKDIVKE